MMKDTLRPGVLAGAALLLAFALPSCAETGTNGDADADLWIDVSENIDGIPDQAPPDGDADGGDDLPGEQPPDADAAEDAPAEADAEVWECGCPDPVLPPCAAPERITFSVWDDSMIEQLTTAMACATETLDIAIYDAQWACVTDAIMRATELNPDLAVRIITEKDNCGTPAALTCDLSRLAGAGRATVLLDTRSYLMHHKFVLVDAGQPDAMAIFGSANWTTQGFCEEYNCNVVIDDETIIDALSAEFDRMFAGDFGVTPWTEPISATGIDLYFSPSGADWQDRIVAQIDALGATATLHFMVASFTRQDIADAMIAAHGRGVTVTGLVSRLFAAEPAVASMLAAGIQVRKDLVHHKVTFIESGADRIVFIGSGNYSTNARDENNEAVAEMRGDTALYDALLDEFGRIWAAADTI